MLRSTPQLASRTQNTEHRTHLRRDEAAVCEDQVDSALLGDRPPILTQRIAGLVSAFNVGVERELDRETIPDGEGCTQVLLVLLRATVAVEDDLVGVVAVDHLAGLFFN